VPPPVDRPERLLLGHEYLGAVAEFDESTGLGIITVEDPAGPGGAPILGFHCTQIADGSRSIVSGTKVRFKVSPSNLGILEAREIRSRPGTSQS